MAITLKGPIQLKESLVLRTVASVPFLAPWQMVAAVREKEDARVAPCGASW